MREEPKHDHTTADRESPETPRRTERRPWQTPHVIESTIARRTESASNLPDDGPQSVS